MGKEVQRSVYQSDDGLSGYLDKRQLNRDGLSDIYRLHTVSMDELAMLESVGGLFVGCDVTVEGGVFDLPGYDHDLIERYLYRFMTSVDGLDGRIEGLFGLLGIDLHVNDYFGLVDLVGKYAIDLVCSRGLSAELRTMYVGYVNRLMMLDRMLLKRMIDDLLFKGIGTADRLSVLPSLRFVLRRSLIDYEVVVSYLAGDVSSVLLNGKVVGNSSIEDVFIEEFRKRLSDALEGQLSLGVSEFSFTVDGLSYRCTLRSIRVQSFSEDYIEVVGMLMDVTELDSVVESNLKRAYHDELTGLPTRELFNKRLTDALEVCDVGKYVGVMFLDVDDFKLINDNYGHDVGDEVLVEISRRLSGCLRSGDVVARNGGDEFTIMCTQVKEREDLVVVVRRVMDSITKVPIVVGGLSLDISLSIGIAKSPADGNDVETLIKHADVAMYKAKSSGKNEYKFFESRMNAEEVARLELINSLRNALNRDELSLKYQLQYDSVKDKYVGMEALMRWNRPEFGNVPTNEFIEIAEESNLIIDMGYWALREGCTRLKELHDVGEADMRLSVNLSSKQFRSFDLVDTVRVILNDVGLPADSLVLEITEKTSMEDVELTRLRLGELRKIGVLVSIDDFGTGFSSLSYLNDFPLTNLKIDQSFVNRMDHSSSTTPMIATFINLAKDIGLDVVAEGVETEMQYDILKGLGCQKFQGYYFAKPMSFGDVIALVESSRR